MKPNRAQRQTAKPANSKTDGAGRYTDNINQGSGAW